MKTLKTIIAALLITATSIGFASAENSPSSKTRLNYAVSNLSSAFSHGKISNITSILDPSAKYTICSTAGLKVLSKSQLIEHLNVFKDIKQNCEMSSQIIDAGSNQAVVKLDMKYSDFTKSNLITLNLTGQGWKITNISTSFN